MAERPRDPKTGRFISAKQAEEVNKKLTETQRLLKDIGKDASISAEAFLDIAKSLIEATKGQEDLETAGKLAAKTVEKQTSIAKELSGFTAEHLANKKQTNKILAKELVVKKNLASIESQIAKLAERSVNAEGEELDLINKSLGLLIGSRDESNRILQNFEKIKDANNELNSKTQFFDSIAEVVDDIPVIGKLFKDFKQGADKAREAAVEGGSVFGAGMKSMFTALGKTLMAFTGGIFLKGLFQANENVTQLSRNLNMSRAAASELNKTMAKAAMGTRAFAGKDLLKATMDLSTNFGFTAKFSKDTAVTLATLTKKLGLSSEEANKLAASSAASGTNVKSLTENVIGTTKAQNILTGTSIRYQDVLKDVSASSNATLMTTSKFPGGIARAAFAARRMGLTLGEVAGISENLLDFESSIANEMEAELLLGRQLNLDKARQAAATGNMAVLAEELNRLTSEGVDFNEMNVFQQQAFAKSLGMSRDQLADSLTQQAALTKLGIDQGENVKQQLKDRIRAALAIKDEEERAKALAKIEEVSGGAEMIRQQENKSFAEAQALAMDRMADSMAGLGTSLDKIAKFFTDITQNAQSTFEFVGKLSLKLKNVFGAVKPVLNAFSSIARNTGRAVKGIAGMAGKLKGFLKIGIGGGIKTILKKIPILGALVGAGLAIQRAKNKDFLGAAMEVASGIASIFPGIGTAASVALDAGLLAMDAKGITGQGKMNADKGTTTVEGEDVVIKTLPKDTLAFAAGTQFGQETNDLLRELLAAVNAGGDVLLDGSKVGDVLMMNSRLTA